MNLVIIDWELIGMVYEELKNKFEDLSDDDKKCFINI